LYPAKYHVGIRLIGRYTAEQGASIWWWIIIFVWLPYRKRVWREGWESCLAENHSEFSPGNIEQEIFLYTSLGLSCYANIFGNLRGLCSGTWFLNWNFNKLL
jgi:predicted secreted protein